MPRTFILFRHQILKSYWLTGWGAPSLKLAAWSHWGWDSQRSKPWQGDIWDNSQPFAKSSAKTWEHMEHMEHMEGGVTWLWLIVSWLCHDYVMIMSSDESDGISCLSHSRFRQLAVQVLRVNPQQTQWRSRVLFLPEISLGACWKHLPIIVRITISCICI